MASIVYKIGVVALNIYLKITGILGNKKSKKGNIGRKSGNNNFLVLIKIKLFGFVPLHGEAIVAMPLIQQIFKTPNHQLVMSFLALQVMKILITTMNFFKCYLPIDFKITAKE